MVSSATVIVIFCIYIGILWCLALWTERFAAIGRSLVNNPLVYSLSLAIYCTSWTFYGSVGLAATNGMLFLAIYLGPTLMIIFWGRFLRKIVRLKTTHRITSIADFISARYERSETMAAVVTLVAVVGTIPYVALQLKSVLATFALITAGQSDTGGWITTHVGNIVVGLMILFTIIFGVRRLEPTERHEGMVMAVAVESVVKLIALVTAGIFVAFWIFNGVEDIFTRLANNPGVLAKINQGSGSVSLLTWTTYLILAANAIICLPRQFHIAVVENQSEKHIKWAMWLFPMYLFIINIFIYPIAMAGLLQGYQAVDADTFVLRLPLDQGNPYLALLVFIGGFSAATSMIMICSMTMSTMISNHLLLPLADYVPRLEFLTRRLLEARWLTVAGFIVLGYGFERLVGHQFKLADIGLLSFGAVFQLGPALFGGLFWRGGNTRGAYMGLTAGFIVWGYTMLLPAFVKSGLLLPHLLETGPFGVNLLRPEALFGLNGLNPVSHAVVWSGAFNLGFYILGSLLKEPSQESQRQAETFVGREDQVSILHDSGTRTADIPMTVKYQIVLDLFSRYFGRPKAKALTDKVIKEAGLNGKKLASISELAELYDQVLKTLGGSIGAATADRALARAEFFTLREAEELREVYAEILAGLRASPQDLKRRIDYYQEREALINKHAEELEEKVIELEDQIAKRLEAEDQLRESEERYRLAIEGSSDGVVLTRNSRIIWGNRRLPEIFGYQTLEEIIGKRLEIIIHPEDQSRVLDTSRRQQNNEDAPSRYDFKGLKKDGTPIYIAVSATTINFHGHNYHMAYFRDVTSRRMAEEDIRRLSRRLIEGIEDERKRLAADLHDEFGQALTALHMGMEATRSQIMPEQRELKDNCDRIIARIEHLTENVRMISGELRPDMLEHFGLVPTVESYITDLQERVTGLTVDFQAAGFGNRKINPLVEITIYRVMQEALNNIVKHSQAGRAAVRLTYSHPQVIMVIKDDGQGFEPEQALSQAGYRHKGIGLISMRERVASAGGTIDIRSSPGKGTIIRVTLSAAENQNGFEELEPFRRPFITRGAK